MGASWRQKGSGGRDLLTLLPLLVRVGVGTRYALYDPEVGYCQGMSFFVAMFLIYRPETGGGHARSPAGQGGGGGSMEASEVLGTARDEGCERAFWHLVGCMWRPSKSG